MVVFLLFLFSIFSPMVTKKSESCTCVDCQCDPCECKNGACCAKSVTCSSSWCNWGAALRIAIAVGLILAAFATGLSLGSHGGWDRDGYSRRGGMMEWQMERKSDKMAEHCQMMPTMAGCEKYNTSTIHTMDMSDPMSMSMADMSQMMVGKTGDTLDRAFLEGMIPHHQGAVDMAKMMAGSKHPELVKFAGDIIAGQSKEIEQMQKWMKDWGYTSTGVTQTGSSNMHMMPDGTMMSN